MPQDIIHERFLRCKAFTFDSYWKEIIHNCAFDRFPKGVTYDQNKNLLHVKQQDMKKISYPIPEGDVETYELLIYIFKEFIGLKSQYDLIFNRQELDRFKMLADLDCEWKKLKPRSIKNHILMNFAVSKTQKPKEAKILYHILQIGFQFKILTNDDIDYEKGVILSINGLEYDSLSKSYRLTNSRKSLPRTDRTLSQNNRLKQFIDKWIREYKLYYLELQ
jgi:hypothetical protein